MRAWIASLLVVFVVAGCSAPQTQRGMPARAGEFYGLWITRWDYQTKRDVDLALKRAASLGVTDVFWQVRGQSDAFYRSELEPWGEELGGDPGFDPLAHAAQVAHANGLRLHAWVNVMPLWRGTTPPRSPNHPFHTHPQWRLRDSREDPQPLNDHYVIVNPVLPEVHQHISNVIKDIVTRYPVDGVHLDYIRFVSDSMSNSEKYPADAATLRMFAAETGRSGIKAREDQRAFRAWIASRITDLVRTIKVESLQDRPGIELSAAVWRRPDLAHGYLQLADEWARAGLVDRLLPMIYTADDAQYIQDLQAWLDAADGRPVTPGIGTYKHKPGQTPAQGELSRLADGFCLFAYAALFESPNPEEDKSTAARRARRNLQRDVANYIWTARTAYERSKYARHE